MSRVVIVNYGMGNIGSVANAIERLGARCLVSDDPKVLDLARGIVLPGVGAFHAAGENIRSRAVVDAHSEQVLHRKTPLLRICLGMQLEAKDSLALGYAP